MIAGAYTGTYNANALALTQDGYTLQRQNHQEVINQSDLFARTIIETFYQGGDSYLQTVCRTWHTTNILGPFWPFGTTLGTLWTAAAPIARAGSAIASALVLTAVAATPAAAAPATLTASKSIVAPDFNGEILFSSRARTVPIRFLLLPTDSAGTGTCLVLT